MARLPDDTALGAIGAPNSGRPIATIDTSGYARGAAAIAQGAKDIGIGLGKAATVVDAVARQQEAEDQRLEVARAKAAFLVGKTELDTSFENDTDHATLTDRYKSGIGQVRARAEAMIRNPKTRELFGLSVADDVARAEAGAASRANALWKDATLADADQRLEQLRESALTSTDPIERKKIIDTGAELIDGLAEKGIYGRDAAVRAKRDWTTRYAAGAIAMLSPSDRVRALRGFEGTLAQRESSGNPALVNPYGYAGLYQFGAPRLADVGLYQPGAAEAMKGWSGSAANAAGKWSGTFNIPGHPEVRTLSDFLASPDAQRVAFQVHSAKMDQEIQANGLDKYIGKTVGGVMITRDGLHAMLHLGGVGGTKVALESDGAKAAKDANGTSVMDYARMGQNSDTSRIAAILPTDTRARMLQESQNEVDRATAKAAAARSETFERSIIDATAGKGVMPQRGDIENDPALDEPRRNTLLRQYDAATREVAGLQAFMDKLKSGAGVGAFNPFDADEKKYADRAFRALGGDAAALSAIVEHTGIMPKSAAAGMRADLLSTDPQRVAASMSRAANLLVSHPNIFTGIDGGKAVEDNAVAYRHYVDDLGLTAADAAKRIIRDQSPEYQATIKAKLKNEDIDTKIRKELTIGDLSGQFDESWLPLTAPNVGFNPAVRGEMFRQFGELVKERYLEHGDWSLAKKQAADQLKKTWGVSRISGSAVVMQYPPERAPAYAGLADPSAQIAKQALDAIRQQGGSTSDIPRGGLQLLPIPGRTAEAYKAGLPPPYMLMWRDGRDLVHYLDIGKGFVADPAAMRQAESEARRQGLEAAATERQPVLDYTEARRLQKQAARYTAAGREVPPDLGSRLGAAKAAATRIRPKPSQPEPDQPAVREPGSLPTLNEMGLP